MILQKLKASDIRTDGGTQMRERISESTVREYAALMEDGTEFPPVVVFFDGEDNWLADGFHRLEARLLLENNLIECDVREGSRRDAILFSISANATHGLARKYGDKKRAVVTLIKDAEWGRWSNACIATRAGVSLHYVHRIRQKLIADGEIQPRETMIAIIGGIPRKKRSTDGQKRVSDRPNFAQNWLKYLVGFSAEQFLQFKEHLQRRETIDRYAAIEAVECVVRESSTEAA